jgi:hypothetical protein
MYLRYRKPEHNAVVLEMINRTYLPEWPRPAASLATRRGAIQLSSHDKCIYVMVSPLAVWRGAPLNAAGFTLLRRQLLFKADRFEVPASRWDLEYDWFIAKPIHRCNLSVSAFNRVSFNRRHVKVARRFTLSQR